MCLPVSASTTEPAPAPVSAPGPEWPAHRGDVTLCSSAWTLCASDTMCFNQYKHERGRAWDVPLVSSGGSNGREDGWGDSPLKNLRACVFCGITVN